MDRVLVTGSSGFIGGRISSALKRRGWKVIDVDLRASVDSDTITLDIADPRLAEMIRTENFGAVIHHAGIADTQFYDHAELRRVNVEATLGIARACADSSTRLIYASSFSVYGRCGRGASVREDDLGTSACSGPLNPYAESKAEVDAALQGGEFGDLIWYGLRYTNVFDPFEPERPASSVLFKVLTAIARGEPVKLFGDTLPAARDYVTIPFVTTVVEALLTEQIAPQCFNVGSGVPISFAEILTWGFELNGRSEVPISLVPNPVRDMYQYWTCASLERLRAALPHLVPPGPGDLREAAARVFRGRAI
jgi:ADP-L-glycero-D-manno-heptose 6-epimerase